MVSETFSATNKSVLASELKKAVSALSAPTSPRLIVNVSNAEIVRNTAPFRLSSITSATVLAKSSITSVLAAFFATLSNDCAKIFRAGAPIFPAISAEATISRFASRNVLRTGNRPLEVTSTSAMLNPIPSSATLPASVGLTKDKSAWRSPVPAREPCIPASDSAPIAADVASTLTPRFAATGAANFIASPNCLTSVLDLFAWNANTSTTWPVSSAFRLKAVNTLEAISAALPRSNAPA